MTYTHLTQDERYQIAILAKAGHDQSEIAAVGLKPKAQQLLAILADDPLQNPPPFEKLVGDLAGAYSRRINIQLRMVYEVFTKEKTVRVLRMWTRYE
jgi:Txe/YoeB family toxin of toxin-antitoxin system